MNARTLIPQQIPSFTKPLLQAFALIVGMTLVVGALWARADGGAADLRGSTAATTHVSR